jgi:hypothetical protein
MDPKTTPRSTKRLGRVGRTALLAALAGGTCLASFTPAAQAEEISPDGKGIAGGILLGSEVVTITESLIGVQNGWAYVIGGVLGAGAGAAGGFAIEQSSPDGQGATYLLAGGMALIIPALVLTLNATRYHPSENATEDKPPPGIPPADPGAPGGTAAPAAGASPSGTPAAAGPAASPASPPPPTSLLDLTLPHDVGFRVGLPVPDVRPMYSSAEQKAYGLPQHPEVRMPVFRLTF